MYLVILLAASLSGCARDRVTTTKAPAKAMTVPANGFVPLPNLGNTCYLNAIMQLLLHASPVRDALSGSWKAALDEPNVKELFNRLAEAHPDFFILGKQQDAHAAFKFIHDDMMMNPSPFEFYVSEGSHCDEENTQAEALAMTVYGELALPIGDATNVEDMLLRFFAPEPITLQRCPGERASMIRTLAATPALLLIVLQRGTGPNKKNHTPVSLQLNMLIGNDLFQLIGIINHHGTTLNSGHYSADILHLERWYRASDAHIAPIKPPRKPSSLAYLLLYQKVPPTKI